MTRNFVWPLHLFLALLLSALTVASGNSLLAHSPFLIPFDETGDLYVLDGACACVLRITPDEEISIAVTTQAITGLTGKSTVFFDNEGIVFDPRDGTMYFVESDTETILRKTPDGTLAVFAKESDVLPALPGATNIDLDELKFGVDGILYATDDENDAVLRFDPETGDASVLADRAAFNAAISLTELDLEKGLVASENGLLYVFSDGDPEAVFSVCPNGTVSVVLSGAPLIDPDQFAARTPDGDILIYDDGGDDTVDDVIRRITPGGTASNFLTQSQIGAVTGGPQPAGRGFAFDDSGAFYLAENNAGILRFDKDLNGIRLVTAQQISQITGISPDFGGIAFAPVFKLYFAQFANGLGLFSQIHLIALSTSYATTAEITLKTPSGGPLSVALDGEQVNGLLEDVMIPASGSLVLSTDGEGDLVQGSATVCSDLPLAGVIVFGGTTGLAGVPSSQALSGGFIAPIKEEGSPPSIRTGFAVMNLEFEAVTLNLALLDPDGIVLATAQLSIPAMGQLTTFADEIQWSTTIDFSMFDGSIRVSVDGKTGAAVIQLRPGQFATMPVAPID